MSLVVDASVVAAALVDSGPAGGWARQILTTDDLAAPQLLPAEVTNVLRRGVLVGTVSADSGALALADLVALRVALFPFEPFVDRIWELRANLSSYDAWYVALAEWLGSELATLDRRLAGSAGPTCEFRSPER